MIIAGKYSFNGGREYIDGKHLLLLGEIEEVIGEIDAEQHKTKTSEEKTMRGKILFSPESLNKAFTAAFTKRLWQRARVPCQYPDGFYVDGYKPKKIKGRPFREMDYIKERLGIEVQFGKYSFMVYNVCAKMTIFNKKGFIDSGVEIVPTKNLADEMSSGVSYFEQFVWDLENRGVSNIDIPVLVLGIDI